MQLHRFLISCLVVTLALVLAPVLSAGQAAPQQQGQTVYSYVAQFRIAPADRSDFVFQFNEYARPVLNRLLADNTLIDWGRTTSVVHTVDGMTDTVWWCATNLSGALKVLEEVAKAKMPPSKAEAHADMLLESLVFETHQQDATGGYLYMSLFTAQAGKSDQWLDAFNRYYRPVFAALQADGAIVGYGVDVEYIHTAESRNRYMWIQTVDAESVDKLNDALAQVHAAMSTAEREAMQAVFTDVMIPETHRDSLDLVVEFRYR